MKPRISAVCIEVTMLLLLNELSDEPHNLMFKLFASRRREKARAIDLIKQFWKQVLSHKLGWIIEGLSRLWFMTKGGLMMEVITPELLMEQGRQLHELAISIATKEDWMLNPEVQEELRKQEELTRKREELRQEELRKAEQRNMICEILTFRFDVQPTRYEQRLIQLELPALEQLRKQGFAVANLAEFDTALTALEQSSDG